jgi:CO/xanthine dehydrogenase FAD-binding subunit
MAAARVRGDDVRVVVGAVTPAPAVLDVDPERPGESAAEQVEPWGSIHASPAYLRQLVRVLVDRAVARAQAAAR